jgi:pimeloyl-ACP methyl ester carboxylesterase
VVIELERLGAGEPLLLLGPLGGYREPWEELRKRCAARFTTLVPRARGIGRSSPAPLGLTTTRMARDLVELLDALEIRRARVFGQSLGALVALELGARAPEKVERLALASGLACARDVPPSARLRLLRLLRCFALGEERALCCLVRRAVGDELFERDPERGRRILELAAAARVPRRTLSLQALAALRHDVRPRLHRIALPALVLAGARDHLIGIEPQRRLAGALPAARFRILQDAGHDLVLEQPAATAAELLAFF